METKSVFERRFRRYVVKWFEKQHLLPQDLHDFDLWVVGILYEPTDTAYSPLLLILYDEAIPGEGLYHPIDTFIRLTGDSDEFLNYDFLHDIMRLYGFEPIIGLP